MTSPPDLQPRVWRLDLVAAAPALSELEAETARLSDVECARAARIREPEAAQRWLAAHIGLRLALESELGADVRRVPYQLTASGKPHLPGAPIAFSLSHSRTQALIALAASGPLGVDIEEPRRPPRIGDDRRAAIIGAAAGLNGQPLPSDAEGAFLQAWVRLEALAKAEGDGLATVLQRVGAFGPGRAQALQRGTPTLSAPHLTVADLLLGAGLYGAIAMPAHYTGAHVGNIPEDCDGLRAFVLNR